VANSVEDGKKRRTLRPKTPFFTAGLGANWLPEKIALLTPQGASLCVCSRKKDPSLNFYVCCNRGDRISPSF